MKLLHWLWAEVAFGWYLALGFLLIAAATAPAHPLLAIGVAFVAGACTPQKRRAK